MDFLLTPEEAQSTALAVVAYYQQKKCKVEIEAAVDPDIAFRPSLTARKAGLAVYVEAQSAPAYTDGVRDLVHSVSVSRANCEVYVAAPDSAVLTGRFLKLIQKNRVGLLLVDHADKVTVSVEAGNPALIVTPEPMLRYGSRSASVKAAIDRFNRGGRKAGLQEMCEIVEAETETLVNKLVVKGRVTLTKERVAAMNWSSRIDAVASTNSYVGSQPPIVDDKLKNDLHSFRGARNLMDHPATTAAARRTRDIQFAERMLMGPRLVDQLVRIRRKVS